VKKEEIEEMRVSTCYHEAAHAVFNYHARLPIRQVYVTEELDAMCVSGVPENPHPCQAMEHSVGLFAGVIAEYRRLGRPKAPITFEEFVSDEDAYEESAELDGNECDELQALKMLRIAASSDIYGDLEECYTMAVAWATRDVELWWPEIVAVAERLRETGRLDGEECVRLIESADYGEE
jgi:hypothetical protein